jgi:hypothetical protein
MCLLRLYADPHTSQVAVIIMSLSFIGFVTVLHIVGKVRLRITGVLYVHR